MTRRAGTKPHIYTDHGLLCTVQVLMHPDRYMTGKKLNTRAMRWTKRRNRVTMARWNLETVIKELEARP